MEAIDRRSALRGILCVVVATGCSTALLPDGAEAMPLALKKDFAAPADDLRHEAQFVGVGPPPRPLPVRHRRRRRRRWTCYWRRGRRVCGWRWVW